MNQETFQTTLRKYLHHRPFYPFQVDLTDGRMIVIEKPALAIGGDSAALITNNDELIEFGCEEVGAIRPVPLEAAS